MPHEAERIDTKFFKWIEFEFDENTTKETKMIFLDIGRIEYSI